MAFPFALHMDPDTDSEYIAVRLRECGRTVARRLARAGDIFALRLLPDGRCLYIHNGHVCYRSSLHSEVAAVYAAFVRVVSQETIPAVDAVVLRPSVAGLPRVEVTSLFRKPPWPKVLYVEKRSGRTFSTAGKREMTMEEQQQHEREEEVIMRVGLHGYLIGAALHTVLTTRTVSDDIISFPTWSIAAFSLLSSFALAAVGCSNDDITTKLRELHRRTPMLLQQENFPKRTLTYRSEMV
ncbi:hypothetical protein LSM04_008410 [Trypanosoma melophagium]|nr:hypothetical protein LSM04_008410 [Trypanosoma melophagium]